MADTNDTEHPKILEPLQALHKDMRYVGFIRRHRSGLFFGLAFLAVSLWICLFLSITLFGRYVPDILGKFLAVVFSVVIWGGLFWGWGRLLRRMQFRETRILDAAAQYFESRGGGMYKAEYPDLEQSAYAETYPIRYGRVPRNYTKESFEAYLEETLAKLYSYDKGYGQRITSVGWYMINNDPVVVIGIETLAGFVHLRSVNDWVVVTPLTYARANIYVDVTDNGAEKYLAASEEVTSLPLQGTNLRVYAATGGAPDAFQMFDPAFLNWLKANELTLDFEIMNDQLILRRSVPGSGLSRKRRRHELYFADLMENIHAQMSALLWHFEDRRYAHDRSELHAISDVWRNTLDRHRWRFMITQVRKEMAGLALFWVAATVASLSPFFLIVLVRYWLEG